MMLSRRNFTATFSWLKTVKRHDGRNGREGFVLRVLAGLKVTVLPLVELTAVPQHDRQALPSDAVDDFRIVRPGKRALPFSDRSVSSFPAGVFAIVRPAKGRG